ncbi:MAG: IS200/IS605 family transposase [Thermoguttaceae bacterium]
MSRNYYSEINLHLTWHTKGSLPLLTPRVEPLVHRYVKQKAVHVPGAFVHEIGGTETHVHVAVSVPPTLLISDFVGQLKGASSHDVNEQLGLQGKVLEWQAGYGVVSFGTGDLQWVREYIRNQREHHASGKIFDRLEQITESGLSGQEPRETGLTISEDRNATYRTAVKPSVNAGPNTGSPERAVNGPDGTSPIIANHDYHTTHRNHHDYC